VRLLHNIDKIDHLAYVTNNNINKFNLNYIFSKKWSSDEDVPYVAKSHLLDSYYLLPERPDIAFTLLWKSINSSYSELWLKSKPSETTQLQDAKSLDFMIERLSNKLDTPIEETYNIKELIDMYIVDIPKKTTKFIANYLLKNYAIEKKYATSNNSTSIARKHISSSYTTFKKKFSTIYDAIIKTYGEKYIEICNPTIIDGTVKLNIEDKNKEKSRKIINSLSDKIRILLTDKKVTFSKSDNSELFTVELNDKEYLNFIIRNILYAIRNNTIHGKIASRLNSKTKNKDSYSSTVYIYLLGYLFLSLLFYDLEYINIEDLKINKSNYIDNISNKSFNS